MTVGRTKAVVKEIGCYADREDDRDLPVIGPEQADQRWCMIHFCTPKVSSQTLYFVLFVLGSCSHEKMLSL